MNRSFSLLQRTALLTLLVSGVLLANPIIPLPSSITELRSDSWSKEMGLEPSYDKGSLSPMSGWVKAVLKEQGVEPTGTEWALSLDGSFDQLGDEGYRLVTGANGWTLQAHTPVGLFYGVQTARQLIAHTKGAVPALEIVDRPSSSWRGLMLDAARNFLGLEYYKRVVDQMSMLKLNRLHIHLSDDQGWRLEIKSLPELTIKGSNSSVGGPNTQGFLTQDEWKELVNYAARRAVVMIPEFDLPGHTHSIRQAYPHLACGQDVGWPYRQFEVGFSQLCWSDDTKQFLRTLIEEWASITPGSWLHIGGDEVVGMSAYATSITFMEEVAAEHGKAIVAWEEGAKGYQRNESVQQVWQQWSTGGVPNWINSRCSDAYIDHSDGGPNRAEPWMGWCGSGGPVTPQKLYNITPGTVGIEAALWGEYVSSPAVSESKIYPRLMALSEAGWLAQSSRDWNSYSSRLNQISEEWFKNTILVPEKADVAEDDDAVSIAATARIPRGTPQLHRVYRLDGRVITQLAPIEGLSLEEQIGVGVLPAGTYIVRTRYSGGGWREQAVRVR